MKFSETNFRAVYHNFCAFRMNDRLRAALSGFPFATVADHVLTYGYIDLEEGLCLEIIAAGIKQEDNFNFGESDCLTRSYVHISDVSDSEFFYFEDSDHDLRDRFAPKIEALAPYAASDEVETIRSLTYLDEMRHPEFPDDVRVLLLKDGVAPEICWVRVIGIKEQNLTGILLNEPSPSLGCHMGERLLFCVSQSEDGHFFCYTNIETASKLTKETLEDGSYLKQAVASFNSDPSDSHLLDILEILRDHLVWMPCIDEDYLIPDLLHHEDDNYFLPVFTSIEDMGTYGDCFAKVQRPFLNVIKMARVNAQKVTAIVVNGFTDPFILNEELWEAVEAMQSKLPDA